MSPHADEEEVCGNIEQFNDLLKTLATFAQEQLGASVSYIDMNHPDEDFGPGLLSMSNSSNGLLANNEYFEEDWTSSSLFTKKAYEEVLMPSLARLLRGLERPTHKQLHFHEIE